MKTAYSRRADFTNLTFDFPCGPQGLLAGQRRVLPCRLQSFEQDQIPLDGAAFSNVNWGYAAIFSWDF